MALRHGRELGVKHFMRQLAQLIKSMRTHGQDMNVETHDYSLSPFTSFILERMTLVWMETAPGSLLMTFASK